MRLSRSVVSAAVGLAGALAPPAARAQEHPIQFIARVTPRTVAPGARARVDVSARIASGWHLYSLTEPAGGPIATTIGLVDERDFARAGPISARAPETLPDRNFQIMTESYADSVTFGVPISVEPSARSGRRAVRLVVSYQTCTDRYCLPPTADTLAAELTVTGAPIAGAARPPSLGPSATVPSSDRSTATLGPSAAKPAFSSRSGIALAGAPSGPPQSLVLFIWLALSMGMLSLLTPCVFPMVPITVSYFTNRVGRGRAAAARGALLYALGIVAAFTALGLVTTIVFGTTGLNRLAADPWLNLGITTLFVVLAFGLFGWINIGVPGALLTRVDAFSRNAGEHASTLLMGLTFALTSFTCTAPFVGTLLVSASQGNWRWPTLGLLVFSSTFALPFVVLALVPSLLARLPRSGEWMVSLKTAMGFLEIAAAAKFVSNADLVWGWNIFTRNVVLWIWIVVGALLALYLTGALRVGGVGARPGWPRRIAAVVVLLVVIRLASGIGGRRLGELEAFLPPVAGIAGEGTADGELGWLTNDLESGLARARSERKPVLVDFTGYTCTNCRWMEANMFPRAAVREELGRFVRVRLFTDGRGEPYRSQQAFERAKFQTVALPLYAVMDTTGAARATFLGMTRDEREFIRFLSEARGVP